MASVAIVFRKDKLNKDFKAPIHLRIIKDRKPQYISTEIMLEEKHWDYDSKKVKTSHPNSKRMNILLQKKLVELHDGVLEVESSSKSLTSSHLKEKIYGKKATDFIQFAEEMNESYIKAGKVGTYDKNKSIIAKLKEYRNGKQLFFQDITPAYLVKYEDYLRMKKSNSTNTIHRDMKFLRRIFNEAYSQDVIDYSINPFLKYRMKTEKTHKTYLTEDELQAFEDVKLTPGTKIEMHKDMFIFAAYTGGLRISDILQLRWKDFNGSHLNITIMKTQTQLSLKIPNKGLEIINRYQYPDRTHENFIFPALPDGLNLKDPRELDGAISRATAHLNKNLSIIAEKAEIKKNVSSHIARHTFATRALMKGMAIQNVSKLMSHSNVAQTMVYAKIVSEELDKAMDIFN